MATQAITQHLLDWIHDLSGLHHHNNTSIDLFYLALTDATSQLQQQSGQVCAEASQVETWRNGL